MDYMEAAVLQGRRLAAERPYDAWEVGSDKVALVGEMKQHDFDIVMGAKSKARTDLTLEEWRQCKYYQREGALAPPPVQTPCARVHTSCLSVSDFIAKYEKPNLPVMIDGICDAWEAKTAWTAEELYRQYRHVKFRCGEDDDGYSVKMKLKYFLRYMAQQKDDSPLYIFDNHFDGNQKAQTILKQYEVPKYFRDDLFRLVGEKRRPPYRWVLVGPKRSGTAPHTDPLATSAWNALLRGRKRWVLFHPDTPRKWVKEKYYKLPREDDEPIDYFENILPRIRAAHPDLKIWDFVQYPGETIFVPSGWWHAVLNLDDTIAVTQNFCSRTNFVKCWRATRSGRPRMCNKFLRELDTHYPDLAALGRKLNEEDKWKMKPRKGAHADGHTTSSTSSDSSDSCSTCRSADDAPTDAGTDGIEVKTVSIAEAAAAKKKSKKKRGMMMGGGSDDDSDDAPMAAAASATSAGAGAGAGAGAAPAAAGAVEADAVDTVDADIVLSRDE